MKSHTFLYTLKVWLTSVALSPFLFIVIDVFFKHNNTSMALGDQFYIYIVYTIFELIFSFLTWLLFTLIVWILAELCSNSQRRILIIFFSGVLLTIATFRLTLCNYGFNVHDDFFYLMLCNAICIGSFVWVYKLEY